MFLFGIACVVIGAGVILGTLWDKMRQEEREAEAQTGPLLPWERRTRGVGRRIRFGHMPERWADPGHTFREDGKVSHRGAHKW